jgi:hypothetical protein
VGHVWGVLDVRPGLPACCAEHDLFPAPILCYGSVCFKLLRAGFCRSPPEPPDLLSHPQICSSTSRLLVQEGVAPAFFAQLKKRTESIKACWGGARAVAPRVLGVGGRRMRSSPPLGSGAPPPLVPCAPLARLQGGDPLAPDCRLGPLVSEGQFSKVRVVGGGANRSTALAGASGRRPLPLAPMLWTAAAFVPTHAPPPPPPRYCPTSRLARRREPRC